MTRPLSLGVVWSVVALLIVACSSNDRPTAPRSGPEFAISDAVHEGGRPGFYFLPPMVAQPTFSGTFSADIATLNPAIAICDVTNGPDPNCGGTGGTPAVVVFATTSTPAVTVDLTTPQYQVNWNTQAAGFVVGHTYRVHVTATTACGARREMGFADVLLTTTPGQAKQLATGDIIVLQDGRTLPIHVRIETGAVGDCWTARASMPEGRAALGVGVVNGIVYAVGGSPPQHGVVGTVYAYDPVKDAWSTKASMPTARVYLGVAALNGILYAVGGGDCCGPFATVEAYDPVTDTWATKASMPTALAGPGVAAINGILYVVGGQAATGFVATVEAYDPVTDTWATKTSMPTPRGGLGLAAINGILYAVGGADNSGASATVEAYDPVTDTWTTKPSMPTARGGLGVAAINGILYAVGGAAGACASGGELATVEAYNPASDTWGTKASMPTARDILGVGLVNGILYTVGGQIPGCTYVATNEAYYP
jgi:hypothetical protein